MAFDPTTVLLTGVIAKLVKVSADTNRVIPEVFELMTVAPLVPSVYRMKVDVSLVDLGDWKPPNTLSCTVAPALIAAEALAVIIRPEAQQFKPV